MFILGWIVLFLLTRNRVSAVCRACSTNNVKCVTSTQFQYCQYPSDDPVIDTLFSCAPGELCNTANGLANPCSNQVVIPECTCGFCVLGVYACISETQFKVCQDGEPLETINTCKNGTKCDALFSSFSVCAANATSGCLDETAPVVCTAPGRFPTPGTACKSYYLCTMVNSVLNKYDYNCTGSYHFNPVLQKCTAAYVCLTT